MRRIITTTVASSLLAFALPAAASAHHAGRHDARAAHHRRHHHRAHSVVFSPASVTPGTPTTPQPTTNGEDAGTVASFESGVLKITLADGTTVSGKVTEMTRIDCGCPNHDGLQGENPGQDDNNGGPGDFHDHGNFQGDDEQGEGSQQQGSSCGTSSLVPGAKVKEAELSVSGAGSVWESVELASS